MTEQTKKRRKYRRHAPTKAILYAYPSKVNVQWAKAKAKKMGGSITDVIDQLLTRARTKKSVQQARG